MWKRVIGTWKNRYENETRRKCRWQILRLKLVNYIQIWFFTREGWQRRMQGKNWFRVE